jgi:putative ABC transport system permease protein
MNQFMWTSSAAFLSAAQAAELDPLEFRIVSVSIYGLVALLTFFSMTVVGSATVNRIRGTFAKWRLMGAGPHQVRAGMWMLVGVASVAGALPGALIAIPVSWIVVPAFNSMAAQSFANGLGSFDPPTFVPSPLAWLASFLLGVLTCMLGAFIPSSRAAKVAPIDALRQSNVRHARRTWRYWSHWVIGLLIMLGAIMLAVAGMGMPKATAFGQEAGQMFNAAFWAGVIASFGVYALVSVAIPVLLGLGRGVLRLFGSATGVLAARSADAKASSSTNTIAPLALALGLSATLLTCVGSYGKVLASGGHTESLNYADSLLMIAVLCVVSLATSMAVIALSNRGMVQDQALLRSIGLSPRRVLRMYVWQSLLLVSSAIILALIPLGVSATILAPRSIGLVGSPIVDIPWVGILIAGLACWLALFLIQWMQIRKPLHRSVAISLRGL